MPNWCEGNLRLRGTKENIKKFLDNEIVYLKHSGFDEYTEHKPEKEESEYEYFLELPEGTFESFYIRNTHRNFFFTNRIEVYWPCTDDPNDEIVVFIDNFNSAWGLREDGWANHARKYGIDIKIFGFELGMQFSEIMTVSRNGKIKKETTKYDDWDWDCPFPNLGG